MPNAIHRPAFTLLLLVPFLTAAFGSRAFAGEDKPKAALRLGHYSSGDGLTGLVLDRTGTKPMIKFDGSDEVLVLTAEPGSSTTRLVRDDGSGVAGLGKYGEVEIYLPMHRDAIEVARDGNGETLGTIAPATAADLDADAKELSATVAKETGAAVSFDFGKPEGADAFGVVRDAMHNAATALAKVGEDELGKAALKKVKKVAFVSGAKADSKFAAGTLTVTVAPRLGREGRPSSAAMNKTLETGL
jgi:hypothetical protein